MEGGNRSLFQRAMTFVLACIALGLPEIASIQVPVSATVLNAPPRVLSVAVRDASVDPRSPFVIVVEVEDNNTLYDVREVRVELACTAVDLTVTVVWTPEGFDVLEGPGEISTYACKVPANLGSPNGTWAFAAILRGDAPAGSWLVRALVCDEESCAEASTVISVNTYVSIAIADPAGLNLTSVRAGGYSATALNVIYTSNADVDLLMSSTGFVGVEQDSFRLPPSAFAAWVGANRPTQLSAEPKLIASRLPRGSVTPLRVALSVTVPQPFYDQEYRGLITVTLRAS